MFSDRLQPLTFTTHVLIVVKLPFGVKTNFKKEGKFKKALVNAYMKQFPPGKNITKLLTKETIFSGIQSECVRTAGKALLYLRNSGNNVILHNQHANLKFTVR